MNAHQNLAFTQLVRAWDRREAARQTGDIRALADARLQLDEQRAHSRQVLGLR
jgi:hypothetical protein